MSNAIIPSWNMARFPMKKKVGYVLIILVTAIHISIRLKLLYLKQLIFTLESHNMFDSDYNLHYN